MESLFGTDVTIDRISFVGGYLQGMEKHLRSSLYVADSQLGNGVYRYNYHMVDGSIFQIAEKGLGIPSARIEFNPNKCIEQEISRLLSYMKDIRMTRIDIAIDYFGVTKFEELYWHDLTNRRKRIIYLSPSGVLETLYIGSGGSEKRFRIYDKAKEQDDYSRGKWWRVEVQIRSEELEDNPFQDIKATWKQAEGLSITEKALLNYLIQYPDEIGQLSKNARTKYKRLMQEKCREFSPQPYEVYEKEKARIKNELSKWKSLSCSTIVPQAI